MADRPYNERTDRLPRHPHVLVVEDDDSLRTFYRMTLQSGYDVVTLADGLEALRHLESERPDLIILDVDLPYVSGSDVQQELAAHSETSAIPVLVVTGNDHVVFPTSVCVLDKPIDADRLLAAVQRCLSVKGDCRQN